MNHAWLLEAALRSLFMGVTVFVSLKVLRIRQVRSQRTAWVLALLAAVMMPALVRWPIGPQLFRSRVLPILTLPAQQHVPVSDAALRETPIHTGRSSRVNHTHSTVLFLPTQPRAAQSSQSALSHRANAWMNANLTTIMSYAAAVYACLAFFFLMRLITGVTLALRLRRQAVSAPWYYGASRTGDDIRISARIHTPATIASSIVLPESSVDWDAAKLRMVLAHERAHVQQADFYIHLLAGLHCAIFWFSPFSWWLQRRLSALGEAMSDLAALQQAESRSSYAEVLLEFATAARQPMAAVSMARSSNLRPRIERLLNDQLFRDAFSARRRHPFLAASIVPIALLASASLVRVHAAVQTPAPPTAPAAAIAPAAAVPVEVIAEQAIPAAPASPATPSSAQVPAAVLPQLPVVSQAQIDAAVETAHAAVARLDLKAVIDSAHLQLLASRADMAAQIEKAMTSENVYGDRGDWNGDSYALVSNGDVNFTGRYDDHFNDIRGKVKGDFIYYGHGGKSYVIQDPALLAKAKELYAPMKELGKQQEELGRQQEVLGKQQEALVQKQGAVKLPTPDLSKELASLDHAMQQLKQLQASKEATPESLADVQGEIGEIQGQLGELQGKAGDQMGKVAEQMGALGAQQGKLGAEQGRLGARQGKIAEEADRRMKPLLDQAIKDGRAKPVE